MLAERALSATSVWTQPALPDEEDIQTRYTRYPSAGLVPATSREYWLGQTVRLHLLDGTQGRGRRPEMGVSTPPKAIHRNLARVPRWAVAAALQNPPRWLTNHVSQPAAVGLVRPDGGIVWLGSEAETGLSYHAEQGVIINRREASRTHGGRNSMNLTTDAWIPARLERWNARNREPARRVPARRRASGPRRPPPRTHRPDAASHLRRTGALDGPADFDDWKCCRPRIPPAALKYLDRWDHAFELFGEQPAVPAGREPQQTRREERVASHELNGRQ